MFAGIDTYKDTLAVAVVDAAGRPRAGVEVVNAAAGFAAVAQLLAAQGVGRVGIEGSGAFGRAVAAYLAAETRLDLREVPTLLTSRERGARPGQGKTDEVDALAIARITAHDGDLPPVRLTIGLAADLRSLLDYRQDLVYERHTLVNQAHAELSGLVPGYQHAHPHLKTTAQVKAVLELLEGDERIRAEVTRRRLARVLVVTAEAQAVRRQITAMVAGHADHVAALYGAGPIIAARFLASTSTATRPATRSPPPTAPHPWPPRRDARSGAGLTAAATGG